MIPSEIQESIALMLFPAPFSVRRSTPLSGGCINQAYRVDTEDNSYFIKFNHAGLYPGMFEAEVRGLEVLEKTNTLRVPRPILASTAGRYTYIIMEFIGTGKSHSSFWEDFGMKLARLHRNTASSYGLDHDNYIGSLPQSNRFHDSWTDFFITERLEPQLKQAADSGAAGAPLLRQFEKLYRLLPSLIPQEPPALIHGDLWNGNYMTAPDGSACLIDPAVHYGHREADLAMSLLFGGFSESFYDAYQGAYPLESGWKERMDIHKLYPLLVHVNLFGGGYIRFVASIVSTF
ncbi:MAG TPA: fructosamine kinase family protein [Bacteroidales bacterium]|nr:fructosamine kinase family protein [Bacteroidales bacterium]HSA42239.1 fructosamine kinase family protein [Bacteroidales bacterium]